MNIYDDISVLNEYAVSQGWYFGAPISEYELIDLRKSEQISATSYDDLFKSWKWQLEDLNSDRKKQLSCYYWAFQYIRIINCLIRGEKDSMPLDLAEISVANLGAHGFIYPKHGTELNYVYEGLKSRFGFIIPKNKHGRLFLTGIGRQSGYFYEKYTQKFLQQVFPEFNRNYQEVVDNKNRILDFLKNGAVIPDSQIMRGVNDDYDYDSIAGFYIKLAELNLQGIFHAEQREQVADYFDLPLLVADNILACFQEGTKEIRNSFALILGDNGLRYEFSAQLDFRIFGLSEQDAFLKVNREENLLSYSYANTGVWKGHSQKQALSDNPEIILLYRDNQTVKEIDITPRDLRDDPIIIFNDKKKHQQNGFGYLRQGRVYYIAKNPGLWSLSNVLYFVDDNGEEYRQSFHESTLKISNEDKWTAIIVKDSRAQVIYERVLKGRTTLMPVFGTHVCCPYIAGKRSFWRFPEIHEEGVESYDHLILRQDDKELARLESVSVPVNLEKYIDGHLYGQFEVEVCCGKRSARRKFTVLPYDLELSPSFHGDHMLDDFVRLSIASSQLSNARDEFVLDQEETGFCRPLTFDNGQTLNFSGHIKRQGAFIRLENKEVIHFSRDLKSSKTVNLDNLAYAGELSVFASPGSAVGVRFHASGKKTAPDYFKKVNRVGQLNVSFPDIRRACSPTLWDRCQSISLIVYSPDGRSYSAGILKAESFSRNPFSSIEVNASGALVVKKEVCRSLNLKEKRSIYQLARSSFENIDFSSCGSTDEFSEPCEKLSVIGLAMVPIEQQELPPLLFLEKPNLYSGQDFRLVSEGLSIEKENNILGAEITDFSEQYGNGGGNIIFLVELKEGQVKRLSRGGFIGGREKRNARIIAFDELLCDEEIELRMRLFSADIPQFIDGLFKNASNLDAHNYFSLISALNPKEVSGYVFSAVDYWMDAMIKNWLFRLIDMEVNKNDSTYEKLGWLDDFWDRQLFSYDDVQKYISKTEAFSEKLLSDYIMRIFNSPQHKFSSWEIIVALMKHSHFAAHSKPIVAHLRSHYESRLAERLESTEADSALLEVMLAYTKMEDSSIKDWSDVKSLWCAFTPKWLEVKEDKLEKKYLHYLAWAVHRWRENPSISLHSNVLRNQLQVLRINYPELYSYLNILLVEIYLKEKV